MIVTISTILILSFIFLLLALVNNFQKQKSQFKKKENRLLQTINTVKEKQFHLNQKVKISEEFNANYRKSKNVIAEIIYEANLEVLKNNSDGSKLL